MHTGILCPLTVHIFSFEQQLTPRYEHCLSGQRRPPTHLLSFMHSLMTVEFTALVRFGQLAATKSAAQLRAALVLAFQQFATHALAHASFSFVLR
jgi:hypothetical protein